MIPKLCLEFQGCSAIRCLRVQFVKMKLQNEPEKRNCEEAAVSTKSANNIMTCLGQWRNAGLPI